MNKRTGRSRTARVAGPLTLALDVGGTDLKAMVLDARGRPAGEALRVATPRPSTPREVQSALAELARRCGPFERASIGFPGVIDRGRIGTAVNLKGDWVGRNLAADMRRRLKVPVRVANDADIQGLGAVRGKGVELVATLGTGFGSSLFLDGRLVPNVELGHHVFRNDKTYEQLLGIANLRRVGERRWNRLLEKAIAHLRVVFNYRVFYLGGGNARLIDFERPKDVKVVSNRAGLLGGIALWKD